MRLCAASSSRARGRAWQRKEAQEASGSAIERCAGGGLDLTSVLDFTVIVVKAWGVNNWQPPYAYYGDEDTLNDRNAPPPTLTGITPMATFDMVSYPKIEIECGRTAFRIKGGTAWDQEHLRIAFLDDFRAKKATCGQVPQKSPSQS